MLSAREFAARQGISVARVHQLISDGKVAAQKIGSSWAIQESELKRRPPVSRPLSASNSWCFIALLSGSKPAAHMDPKARWRLDIKREALAEENDPAVLLASWLRKRAPLLALHANPADLNDLRKDDRVVLSGISDERAGLSSEHEVEAYVDPELVDQLKNEYLLVAADAPNVWLHLARVQADEDGRVPLGLVIADLADHNGPRENQRVRELLAQR